MEKYELWLDESGDFSPENEANENRHPSLVGGLLVPAGAISDSEITRLLGEQEKGSFAHAMDMGKQEMAGRVLPALEQLHQKGAKLVYFENAERLDIYSSRELYLRLLAGGLIQLMQRLAAEDEFFLDVMIAARYVEVERGILDKISDESYIKILRSYIRENWKGERLQIPEACRLNLTVLSARQERRLQLADFACNARLTMRSGKFDADMRLRLEDLFEDDFIYSVTVNSSENLIYGKLADNNVSGALMEYYTGKGSLDRESIFALILDKLDSLSYIQASRQLEDFSYRIVSFTASWYDFEQNEEILKEINETLFPEITRRGMDVKTDAARFRIFYCLCDMYITEGDLLHAGPVLEDMHRLIRDMNYRIENLENIYYYHDRKALYQIACQDFDGAIKIISINIRLLQNIIDLLDLDNDLHQYLGEDRHMRSEMLARALTAKLHAQLYQLRFDKTVYEDFCQTADMIRSQYNFPGEMQRMLQYRARAEMEMGHTEKALQLLLESEQIQAEGKSIKNVCIEYLDKTLQMDPESRAYNMVYYVELMESAMRHGDSDLAGQMQAAIEQQKSMRDEILTETVLLTSLQSDVKSSPVIYEDILQKPLLLKRRKYHPLEIVCWKYASYLARTGAESRAQDYFEKAILICGSNPDYAMLHMTGLAVRLERFYWALVSQPLAQCKSDYNSLTGTIKKRKQKNLNLWPGKMQDLVNRIEKTLRRFPTLKEEEAADFAKEIYELSQAVPF